MRNVTGLTADAIRKAVLATAEQVVVKKAVKGAAVGDELVQIFVAGNANRGIRLGVSVDHKNIRSLRRKRFSQCDDRGGLAHAALHVCDSNELSCHAALPRQSV